MAWLPSLHGLTLLLTLLSPFWTPTRAGDRKVVVLAPPEVHGSWGDTVNLMCNLKPVESKIPRVKQVRWERLEPWGELSTVAEFDWVQGARILEPDRVQFVAAGKDQEDLLDASLTLTELHPDDDANYTCEVITFQHGSGKASTWLRVFYAPQVSISLYDDTRQQDNGEICLSCDARGNPKPEGYKWSTTTGPLPPSAVPQGSWLLLQPSEESINTTFICFVFNDLGTAQVAMKVLLPGSSKKHSLSFLILSIVLSIVGLMTVVFVVLIYFQCSRKSRPCAIWSAKGNKSAAGSDPGENNWGFCWFQQNSTDPFSRISHDNPTGQPSSASVARESTGVTVELRQDSWEGTCLPVANLGLTP